jgi:hypothetical protein
MLTVGVDPAGFYEKICFGRAGKTVPMLVYGEDDHRGLVNDNSDVAWASQPRKRRALSNLSC